MRTSGENLSNGISVLAAVVDAGSFTGAADVLDMSAPGVSRAIARLERRLKIRLFNRTTRTVALTEEVWVLGETLPGYRIMLIALASVVTLAFFIKALFYAEYSQEYRVEFVKRVVAAYTITLLVALILLFLIDKGPIEDPVLTLNRAVIIAFPASFAATAVDYIK